ncbi:MAG: DNA repair and recombination protein RadA [Candidatus Nanohaloarchaeota archaeon QJJ-9]|nr:DNA repair and recombination protein RadA [Candidatus Nanohaloarchaeota archaeon QJJ-9]
MSEDEELEDLSGVGSKTAEKLRDAGYDSIMSIATMSAADLSEVADIGNKTAQKIIKNARDELNLGFQKGTDKMEERENMSKITLGSDNFDELLDGGIETQAITEVYGEYGSAKTQCALQAAVNVQMPKEEGGLDKGVIFIDTEDTFIPERAKQMAEANDMDPEEVLDNIYVARAFNSDHQILLAEKAQEIMEENEIGLVVVDSLTAQFRSDYVGRGELAERQQKLNKHIHTLQRLASAHNVAVLVTNQVLSNPGQLFGDPTNASGGHIVGHASSFRLYLRKSKKDKRIARLVDCPYLPEGEAVFKVKNEGIVDP